MSHFKKTLLGAAIAASTMAVGTANAYMIGDPNDANVEVYGVVSISAVDYNASVVEGDPDAKDVGWALENETRVGFRAAKVMTDSVTAFAQVESGWVLDSGATLGNRDTFVGFRGDDWGQVRFGRMLTPLYELVDWPYSASNLGRTFDRGWQAGERFHFDRKSQMGRYDSPMFGDMVKFSLAGGNGSTNSTDSNFYGGSVSITPVDMLTLHAAFEMAEGTEFDTSLVGDTDVYFAGFELRPLDNFNILGAYKSGSFDADSSSAGAYKEREIDAYSIQANYYMGDMNVRVGYADQSGKEDGSSTDKLDSTSISGELGYSFNSVYTFLRLTQQSSTESNGTVYDDDLMIRVGTEWVF
ncbi:putative porin [Vibrio sinaloensis DSM 21326]|uniref:Putative porin n=1 Tax=Vibrio sinaloensis DSM 21326 TaxID=945550 RepID=E8M8Z1_PHOS4|nr:porin [Vibrio sinaloensis]EGA69525.1 putative porin [Vibrio sinaloensis DSM 21326]